MPHRRLAFLLLAAVLGGALRLSPATATAPRLGGDPIAAWVFHFDDLMPDAALAAQSVLMQRAAPGARLVVAVTGSEAESEAYTLLEAAGAPVDRIEFLRVTGPLSPWARDRYTVVADGAHETVIVPPRDVLAATWRGDAGVGGALVGKQTGRKVHASQLYVEGGDLLVGRRVALVGRATVLRESRRLRTTESEIERMLAQDTGRRVVVIGREPSTLPHDHLDMFLTLLDDRTVLLGDPRLTASYFAAARELGLTDPPVGEFGALMPSLQEAAAPAYAQLAEELLELGFAVHRIPIVHTLGDTLLTWNNAVTERRGEVAIAYMPTYQIPHLDRLAERVYRQLGFTVHPVPCAEIILHGGAVRCITNDLRHAHAVTDAPR